MFREHTDDGQTREISAARRKQQTLEVVSGEWRRRHDDSARHTTAVCTPGARSLGLG